MIDYTAPPSGCKRIPVRIPNVGEFVYAVVDEADYPAVARWKWQLGAGGYARRNHWNGERYEAMYMHRYLMQTPSGMDTDHINREKLDNRRSNLRAVDRATNNYNTPPARNNTSGVKGVGYFKPAKLWRAYIKHKSSPKRIELGYFKTKEEAIAARKAAEGRLVDGPCG